MNDIYFAFVLGISTGGAIGLVINIIQRYKIMELKGENIRVKSRIKIVERNELNYKKQVSELEINNELLWNRVTTLLSQKTIINTIDLGNKSVVKAIKKAMIYSHPDKGICINNDDFIEFRELYNKYK